MRRYQQRQVVISKRNIAKQCRLFGPLMQGARAFREGILRTDNPYLMNPKNVVMYRNITAWYNGWDMAEEKNDTN